MNRITFPTILLGMLAGTTALAQPPSEGGRQHMPAPTAPSSGPAVDAALGRPPPDATVDPTTREDPNFVQTTGSGTSDQAYGPTTQTVGPDGQVQAGYNPYGGGVDYDSGDFSSTTPEFHTVQKGDTLWGISGYYMRDPYQWPRLWSFNDHITNAHWIFPGDRVRLSDPFGRQDDGTGAGPVDGGEPRVKFTKTRIPVSQEKEVYVMNQNAFVDTEEMEQAMKVVGGHEAKVMMATLDKIYMEYDKQQPPVAGERLVIYTPQEPVRDFESKDVMGYLVEIVGEVEIDKVARETAQGTVALALNPIERGYLVGPLRRRFKRVTETPAEGTEVGRVITTVVSGGPIDVGISQKKKKKRKKRHKPASADTIAGEEMFVITNLGADQGVKEGNILEAVRKGDEHTDKHAFKFPYEDGWPRRVVGRILVLEVQPKTSLGVVIWSVREIERGEYVEMRPPGMQDSASEAAARAEASASGRAGRGGASGEASFSIGK